jgi:hypothetical protein
MNNPENPPAEPQRPPSDGRDTSVDGGGAPSQANQPHEVPTEHNEQPIAPQGEVSEPHPYPAQPGFAQPNAGQYGQSPEYGQAHQHGQAQDYAPTQAYAQPQQYPGTTSAYPPQPQQGGAPTQPKPRRPKTDGSGVAYGVGPFTLREVIFVALAALVLISSFLPFIGGVYADLFGYTSLWAPAPWLAIPGALLLAAAAALMVLRRLQPTRRLRVGSLSVDQFASAMAIATAGFYVGALFLLLGFSAWFGGNAFGRDADVIAPGPGLILGLIFAVASLVPTTFAPFTAPLKDDFTRREEIAAHPLAREATPVPRRPRPIRPDADHRPEVHSYGQENTGTVHLTPADARPEDFAAYRRKGWSPEPAGAYDETVNDPFAELVAEDPQTDVLPAAAETTAPRTNDDDVDEIHFADEPAPVSAIRHVAEQETLGDAESPAEAPAEPARADSPAVEQPVEVEQPSSDRSESGASASAAASPSVETPTVISTQPFWVYSPVPLPIVDEVSGHTVFEIGPSAWALAIVDRGSELVIRHDDGRVGVLRQVGGIMRG